MPTFEKKHNPIYSLGGVVNLPVPKSYKWSLIDDSASDAGRTQDDVAHKKRIGQNEKITLEYPPLKISEMKKLLKAVNDEYVTAVILSAISGDFITEEFTVGDRASTEFDASTGKWKGLSFSLTTRRGKIRG